MPKWIELHAGPLRMVFDAEWAYLRRICLGEREVLRGVYAAVRDQEWSTVPPRVGGLQVQKGDGTFRVSFDAACRQGGIDFLWRGTLAGEPDGTVTFAMRGTARSTFLRNRIGFCVLHPARECAGKACTVEKTDGSREEGRFPRLVAPHQPFLDVRAIAHEVAPGVVAEVRCEGDAFETEDQRNWTDASFKTYCTPLERPRPVEVQEGTTVEQTVTLRLRGEVPPSAPPPRDKLLAVELGESPCGPLPRLGLAVASHGQPLSARETARLKALRLAHLRTDLAPSQEGWRDALARAGEQATAVGAELEVALSLAEGAEEAELEALAEAAKALPARVARWLVFPLEAKGATKPGQVPLARRHLPGRQFGGGTSRYFTELNRDCPPVAELDVLAYAFTPQVHTFDNASVVENLEGQGWTVATARQFAPGLPLALGPVTLRPRGRTRPPAPGTLPPSVDPRQGALFAAAWTVGMLQQLAQRCVHSITAYETTGGLGVMETEAGSPAPDLLPSRPGCVFPVYLVFDALADFAGGETLAVAVNDPLRVAALGATKGGKRRMLLANLDDEPQEVVVRGLEGLLGLHRVDDSNVAQATRAPEVARRKVGEVVSATGPFDLALPPHALVRIDASR
ncbi:MAG: hypothetical protein ACLF0G_00620 [Candidatus Brocadiia bacterium]